MKLLLLALLPFAGLACTSMSGPGEPAAADAAPERISQAGGREFSAWTHPPSLPTASPCAAASLHCTVRAVLYRACTAACTAAAAQIAAEFGRLQPIDRLRWHGRMWEGVLSMQPALHELEGLLPATFSELKRGGWVGEGGAAAMRPPSSVLSFHFVPRLSVALLGVALRRPD